MTESYKFKSRLTTAISFLAAFVIYVGQDGLKQVIPTEYAWLIPIIIFLAGYIATQKTEDKRVETAEQLVEEKYAVSDPTANEILNDEYVGEEDGA